MPGPGSRSGGPRRDINIQDGFLFQSLKESRELAVMLLTGKAFKGTVKRFDRFAVIFEIDGLEVLVYKHAVVSIGDVPGAPARESWHERRPPHRPTTTRPDQWPVHAR